MKKSIVLFLLLSACQSPVQENKKMTAFRSCHSLYQIGTREFENCMKEQEERERTYGIQKRKETMRLLGGRELVRQKESEIDTKKARWKHQLMMPTSSN